MLAGNSWLDHQVPAAPWGLPVVLLVLVLLLRAYRRWRSSLEENRRAVSDVRVLVDHRGFVHRAEPTVGTRCSRTDLILRLVSPFLVLRVLISEPSQPMARSCMRGSH